MKKITSLLSTVFISSMHLFSQPTITSSILPSVGVEITHNIYDAKNFSPGAIGASVTWDFSQMTKGQVSTFSYVDPSTVVGSSAYPNANICAVQGDYKVFMTKSTSEYLHQGSIYSATSFADYNQDPQELIFFPISYLDQRNETFTGIVDWGSFKVDRDGITSIEADAYGTLILPHVTLEGVLRIKTFDSMEDSINGSWQGSYEYTTFQWYHPAVTDAVLTWTIYKSVSSTSTKIDTSGVFNDLTSLNAADRCISNSEFNIFPNPCSEKFTIELNTENTDVILMQIIDVTGHIAQQKEISCSGHFSETFQIKHLQPGIYRIVVSGRSIFNSEKLIVR